MRRVLLLLTVAALLAVMMVANAAAASADEDAKFDRGLNRADDFTDSFGDFFVYGGEFAIDAVGPQNKAADKRGFVIVEPSR